MKTLLKSLLAVSALFGVTAACQGTTLRFDGADDYVLTPNLRSFFTNETVTIEVWINARGPGVIVDERQATSLATWANSQIEIVATTNALQGEVRVRVWQTAYVSLGKVNYGTWNHAALRYDKAALTLDGFLNGAKSANIVTNADRLAPWESNGSYGVVYALGLADSQNLGSGAWFNGLMDEFRVWNTPRTDAEIAGSWNRRLAGTEPGLVAYYPMEEGAGTTTADGSGHANIGALVNGVLWNAAEDAVAPVARTGPAAFVTGTSALLNGWVNTNGVLTTNYFEWWSGGTTNQTPRETVAGSNSVLNLDGFDDHVVVPAGIWFSNDFTIEAWVYERSYNNWSRVIDFGNGAPSDNVLFALSAGTTGTPSLSVYRGATQQYITAPHPIPLNQWVHLATTLKSGAATLYVNGVAVVSGPVWTPNVINRTKNYVGRSNWGVDAYANAMFEDLRIWNVARTADQIRQFMKEPVTPDDPNLVLNHRFDQPSGNGTLTNGASLLSSVPVSAPLSALVPGTLYHFRAVAEAANGVSPGNVERLATLSPGGGTALEFDGANDIITVPDGPSLDLTGNLTFETWVKFRQVTRTTDNYDWQCFFAKSAYNSSYALMLCTDTADKIPVLRFYHAGASPAQSDYSWTGATSNRWYHVATTFGGGAARIYIDGELKASTSVSGSIVANALPLQLGYSSLGGYPFDGQMDEVRIWNQVRSGSDILQSMNERLTGSEPGLVACYHMDEGAGRILVDATTNAAHGLPVNGPLWAPSAAPVGIPIARTMPATFLDPARVTLNGLANPSEPSNFAWFEWGTSTNYDQATSSTNVDSALPVVAVSAELSGLTMGIIYHYRLVASNSAGIYYGADRTFDISEAGNLADSGPGSLRQAISSALPGAILLLTNSGTITLTSGELLINKDLTLVGPGAANLAISGNNASRVFNISSLVSVNISGLTIRDGRAANGGTGAAGSSGGGIYNAGTLMLSGCVITNNRAGDGGAGAGGGTGAPGGDGGPGGYGGGIYNASAAELTLRQCTVSGNSSGAGGKGGDGGHGIDGSISHSAGDGGPGGAGGGGGLGGGIYGGGIVTFEGCTLAGNFTRGGGAGGNGGGGGDGGAWRYDQDGGNGGPGGEGGAGGGVYELGQVTLSNSTLSGNSTGAGGAGGNGGHAGSGGYGTGYPGNPGPGGNGGSGAGLCSTSNLELRSDTIVRNVTGTGGLGGYWPSVGPAGRSGLGGGIRSLGAPVEIANTIVGLNTGDTGPANTTHDIAGAFASLGGNLVSKTDGGTGFSIEKGDVLNALPLVGPLADNGGSTWTHALWPESPAVNAGTNVLAAFVTDQRGGARIVCSQVDIGAFEYNGCPWLLHPAALNALYFDGRDDFVQGREVSLSNSCFTVEAWAKRDMIGTGDCILGQGTSATNRGLHFGFRENNSFTFAFFYDDLNTTNAYTDAEWHHWAGTYDTNSRMQRLYLDGVLVTNRVANNHYLGTGPLRIGKTPWDTWAFGGVIDEVRVWNVARTAEEIAQNHNRSLSGVEPHLVACYRFNEGSGTKTADSVTGFEAELSYGQRFVTSSAPLFRPIVTTLAAESVRATTATLRGKVNPAGTNDTAVWFEYGTSPYLGVSVVCAYLSPGLTPQSVSLPITNLESGTKYYFRLAANNAAGTVYGETLAFDTLVVGSGYPISTRANNGQNTTAPRHITDSEGNIYLAGLFTGAVQFKETLQAAGSPTNAFLAKLARRGDWRWAINIPVTNGQAQIKGLALENGTNVLATGTFSGTATFGTNHLTATNGTRAFIGRFEPAAANWTWAIALGAGTNNCVNALAVSGDGSIYVAGQFSGETSFGTNSFNTNITLSAKGGADAFVARFSATGRPDWATQAGGSGTTNHDSATALALGPFGEIYVTGFFKDQGSFGMNSLTSAGGSDLFFAALNATDGLIQRAIRAGGTGEDRGTSLAIDPSGDIYLVAQLEGAANFDGAPLPELDSGGMNLVVAQLNRQCVLSRRAAARAAFADSIVAASSGHVYLAGDFTGVMRYGPTLTVVGTGTNASSDVFLAQLAAGTDALNWADFKQIGGIGTETRGSVSVDPSGSVVVSGTYAQSLHLGYVELSTPNAQEIFLARLDSDGTYEHNRWEIGQALIPPDEALVPPFEQNRAKGFPRIEILKSPGGLEDSTDWNSFFWNDAEKKLYAIRPVTARIKWPLDETMTNLANVATMVGRCYWDHVQTNVAGAPVEVEGPGVGQGFSYAEVAFNTNGANVLPVTRGTQQFRVFQTATNASGYNVIRYTRPLDGGSVFDVVYTRPYGNWCTNESAYVGAPLSHGRHQDFTRKNGYVFFERSFYDAAAHDRATRTGPILPVNRNLANDPNQELVVVWYRTNEWSGVAWGSEPVRYDVDWPEVVTKLVVASGEGFTLGSVLANAQAHVYQQPDRNLAGFNPNEEHALIIGGQLYAIRCDLNDRISPKASEPHVLLKYLLPGSTNEWRMKVFKVVAEDENHSFAHFAAGMAGLEVQLPAPLNMLALCGSSNRIAFGHAQGHQAWNGRIYAKSAGYLQVQYWYPTLQDFYFGATNPPVGSCVPWMSQYAQVRVEPGATPVLGEPVLVGYDISWPSDVASLQFGETLTTPKHDLPDLLSFASARVIYDEGNPDRTNHLNSLVRIFDPLSERTIQLSNSFKLPPVIARASDRGRVVLTGLPYPLRIRLFYDELNQRLSFGGWYDAEFGTGEPLLLPNILSPRERDRIKQLDGTNTVSDFDKEIDRLYDLTRNPNQVDVDGDRQPDKELRAGLITQIRDGFNEILIGPVMPGPSTNYVTWRTNILGQPVNSPVTNIIQEQFGDLPKALTAGLRCGSGYVTVIENDDLHLPGQPIALHIIYVTNSLFQGDLKVLPSDNVFDERLTLRHSADFGGEPQNYEFEWYYQPDQDGVSPPMPVLTAGLTNWNGWILFPTPPPGTNNGVNDVTLGEGGNLSSLMVLSDNWLLCRYRAFTNGVPTGWSDWVGAPGGTGAMLAQGWIKRVLAGLNEFDSRVQDFHQAAAATYASMILQAGQRYEGPVAFNPDPNYLNSLGLIESYETVLDRGRKLSIDGLPAVNFGPANNALLRAAGKIADLYMLLGNEAYADASDPTIGFTTASGEYGNLAPSIFCFQNQLDSPLEEELALLRGRDDSGMTVRATPVYNRLIWNFTLGEGEAAYKLTYNISDQNGDGFIDEKDARILYPQGHGDAWGHYLTAIKKYYELLRHPNYEWVPRPEAVTVAGSPVQVDYLDERKFARAAAAKARTGAEIVNLTYRQKYVADPAGQWQGYNDTQQDRAWGVDQWARRAGAGAYLDWVAANAILPAADPDTNHVGIQKIDRTTVSELTDIAAQFAAIEAQLDAADRGLNPLGLAVGAMPFDLDPSKVAAGQTHFDQIYERAVKAMENTLALFDYVNTLSQNLRRNQDDVDQFAGNVAEQERDYRNRMIEIFGYPYAGDIGPAGTYPSGYEGPDLYHYMYVNASNLTGDKTQPDKLITGYYRPLAFPGQGLGVAFFPDDVQGLAQPALSGDNTFHVSYPMVENGAYQFEAPGAWGSRRAPGKIQNALSEMLKARAQLNQGLISYDNLRRQILDEIELLKAQADMATWNVATRTREVVTLFGINALGLLQAQIKEQAAAAEQKAKAVANAASEGIPKSVGLANDVGAPARASILTAGNILSWGFTLLKVAAMGGEQEAENAKLILESQTALSIECATQKYEIEQRRKVIEQLCREEVARRVELYSLQENVQQTCGAYLSVLAEGQRLMEERYDFRVKTAAQVQEYRYQDMAFRIFQNDALQKYRAQFDLAARYVYLAAKAYDYETCLLNSEIGAGSKLLTDIVRQRTLGQLVNGLPVSGRHGLADPLARMGQNFEVYRGQLGFTTPETETGRFSLRSELFRIRPGDLQTNVLNGIVSTNQDWNAMLQNCRVPDLWQIPEFRRFCRPFAPESAGPQPGLVIRIPTTITFGLNYFGWPLGPGDSAYDSSRFATKVRSAGIWFADYNLAGLSMTPRVYLVPVGTDIMRSPSSDELETREFNVVDQKLPVPFPIGATDLSNPGWIPVNDSLSETFGDIRRFSSFRAYHDKGWFDENEATQDTRLIGRSVWNTEWLLIIPGGTFLYDPNRGLDTFINTVGDIKIFFQTYSYSGN